MDAPAVLVSRLDDQAPLPSYAHEGDAGADLATMTDLVIGPGERVVTGTGIAVAIPEGYAGFVYPRSGLAARHGLSIVNTPGVIDAGYRGEIKVCLINHDLNAPIELKRGDLIAQMVIQAVSRAQFTQVGDLPDSERGTGGYGSSGGVAGWRSGQQE